MKKMMLLLPFLFATQAMASTGQIGSGNVESIQKVIENSKEFKSLQRSYAKVGGSFTCKNFVVASTADLQIKMFADLGPMVAQTVIADCSADPNDDLDPISQKLISVVTVTNDGAAVVSLTAVTPPQPD